jgi:hypothetical protein
MRLCTGVIIATAVTLLNLTTALPLAVVTCASGFVSSPLVRRRRLL